VPCFLIFDLMGFDMFASGAIPVIAATIPSSLLTAVCFSAGATIPFLKPITEPLIISTAAMFVLFPVLSGGMNALLCFSAFDIGSEEELDVKVSRKG